MSDPIKSASLPQPIAQDPVMYEKIMSQLPPSLQAIAARLPTKKELTESAINNFVYVVLGLAGSVVSQCDVNQSYVNIFTTSKFLLSSKITNTCLTALGIEFKPVGGLKSDDVKKAVSLATGFIFTNLLNCRSYDLTFFESIRLTFSGSLGYPLIGAGAMIALLNLPQAIALLEHLATNTSSSSPFEENKTAEAKQDEVSESEELEKEEPANGDVSVDETIDSEKTDTVIDIENTEVSSGNNEAEIETKISPEAKEAFDAVVVELKEHIASSVEQKQPEVA